MRSAGYLNQNTQSNMYLSALSLLYNHSILLQLSKKLLDVLLKALCEVAVCGMQHLHTPYL